MIGGNTELSIKVPNNNDSKYDSNGKRLVDYIEKDPITGWIDLMTGDSKYTYQAKLEESTHIFLCDYDENIANIDIEEARAVADNEEYDVLYIDDPMNLHQHLEIYLKKVGGQHE